MFFLLAALLSAIGLLLAVATVVLGAPLTLPLQLIILPFANIYVSGASLLITISVGVVGYALAGRIAKFPLVPAAIWTFWLLGVLCSFLANQSGSRAAFQIGEFILYGLITVGSATLIRQDPRLVSVIITAARISASILSIVLIVTAISRGEDWPDGLIGRNEAALTVVTFGIAGATGQLTRIALPLVSRILPAAEFGLYVSALLAVGSRAGAVVAAAVVVSILAARSLRRAFALLGCLAVGLVGLASNAAVRQTALEFFGDPETAFSNLERIGLLSASWRLTAEKPWLGWGWGSVDQLMPIAPETMLVYPHPHNTYAHFFVELGIWGGIVIFSLYACALLSAWRQSRLCPSGQTAAVLGGMVGLVLMSMSDDVFYGASRGLVGSLLLGLTFANAIPDTRPATAAVVHRPVRPRVRSSY